jgi:hypothetical protein
MQATKETEEDKRRLAKDRELRDISLEIQTLIGGKPHTPFETQHNLTIAFCMFLSFGLSLSAHLNNYCMRYASEIYVTTSSVYGFSWLLLGLVTGLYVQQITFCNEKQKSNRACLLISGYTSLGASLMIYDAYTIIGGTLLGILGILQVMTTIILFVVCFMHGHSPKCLSHIDNHNQEIKENTQGCGLKCIRNNKKIVGIWIGVFLILFIVSQLVLVSLVIGFDYTLKNTTKRGEECGNL